MCDGERWRVCDVLSGSLPLLGVVFDAAGVTSSRFMSEGAGSFHFLRLSP